MSTVDVDLGDLLAKVLPTGVKLTIRHVSSVPTRCVALFAPPPGEEPESTFCENHFLTVSIAADTDTDDGTNTSADKNAPAPSSELIVFGIEVLVYSTAHLTTIFVSKADSTGHLHLLRNAPKISLLRRVSNTFLSFLVQTRQRPGVRLVVSLFARAQNQYLFPGSVENAEKHVLDDRGLIKWWCRVVDPILREYEPESRSHEKGLLDRTMESSRSSATAFLIVPSCDRFETRSFFPPSAKSDDGDRPRWLNSYPLRQLCDNPHAPPRCLIPRFPDDPKTRFLVDLDDELPGNKEREATGQWRSVRSLDQFWEMMSFRQECSAGRLVGFLWLVINPPGLVNSVQMTSSRLVQRPMEKEGTSDTAALPPTSTSPASPDKPTTTTTEQSSQPSQPTIPPSPTTQTSTQPADSDAFYWPSAGRGHAVLSEEDYKTTINHLLDQDFYNEEVSVASTRAWSEKVASVADQLWVGREVVGRNPNGDAPLAPVVTTTLMDSGLVRKRKKPDAAEQGGADSGRESGNGDVPDTSSPATGGAATPSSAEESGQQSSGVNVLQGSLIRKKKKA